MARDQEWGSSDGDSEPAEAGAHSGGDGTSLPSEMILSNGMKLVISPDAFRTIMHTPLITQQVEARCIEMCDMANNLAVEEGAEYIYFVSNDPNNIRARGRVKPGNEIARRDDAIHSTLLRALASVGSDPLPQMYQDFAPGGSAWSSGPGIDVG